MIVEIPYIESLRYFDAFSVDHVEKKIVYDPRTR